MSNATGTQAAPIKNTNRWSTRELVTMALMCAISVILSFLETPPIFAGGFLRLDVSLTPAMVTGFAFGPAAGTLVGAVSAIAHGMITGNWVGALMNIIVAVAFVLPASLVYARNRAFKGAGIGMAISIACMVVVAVVANLIIDPLFYGLPLEMVVDLIAPALVPFNILKGVVNAVLTFIVYKSISNLITPKKSQVQGR